jgi:hypothetical protein
MHGVLRKKKYCYIILTGCIFDQKNKKNPDARQPFGSTCKKMEVSEGDYREKTMRALSLRPAETRPKISVGVGCAATG